MNWLDIAIIVPLALFTYVGWRTGIIRAALTVVGIVLGIYLAGVFFDELSGAIDSIITSENAANVVAFAIIFLIVFVVQGILGSVLKRVLNFLFLGWIDSSVGAALGLAVGATLAVVAIVVMNAFGMEDQVDKSFMGNFFLDNYPVVLDLLPEEFDVINEHIPESLSETK